jgi:hypothetical protein
VELLTSFDAVSRQDHELKSADDEPMTSMPGVTVLRVGKLVKTSIFVSFPSGMISRHHFRDAEMRRR